MRIKQIKPVKTENIEEGMEFKSYRELCGFLGEPVKGGCAKEAQVENWGRYFEFERNGNTWKISRVFDEPIMPETALKYFDTIRIETLIFAYRYIKRHYNEIHGEWIDVPFSRAFAYTSYGFCKESFYDNREKLNEETRNFVLLSDPGNDEDLIMWMNQNADNYRDRKARFPALKYNQQVTYDNILESYNNILVENIRFWEKYQDVFKREAVLSEVDYYAIRVIVEDESGKTSGIHRFTTSDEKAAILLAEKDTLSELNRNSLYGIYQSNDPNVIESYKKKVSERIRETIPKYKDHYRAIKLRCIVRSVYELLENILGSVDEKLDQFDSEMKVTLNRQVVPTIVSALLKRVSNFVAIQETGKTYRGKEPTKSQLYEYNRCRFSSASREIAKGNDLAVTKNLWIAKSLRESMGVVASDVAIELDMAEDIREKYVVPDDEHLMTILRSTTQNLAQ